MWIERLREPLLLLGVRHLLDASVSVAVVTGIFGIVGMVIKHYFDNRSNKKAKAGEVKALDLTQHNIFLRLDILETHISVSFELPNKGKEIVFKHILIKKITFWRDSLMELAKELNNCREDSIDLCELVLKHDKEMKSRMQNFYNNADYTADEKTVLTIVMEKFYKWHYPRVQYANNSILSICNSPFYTSNVVRSSVIFDMYVGVFIDMLSDAESTLNSINGDLNGLEFRGYVI